MKQLNLSRVIFLIIACILLLIEILFNQFSVIEHITLTIVLVISMLSIWGWDYNNTNTSNYNNVFRSLAFIWFLIAGLIFYKYDVDKGFIISNNAVLLIGLILSVVSNMFQSKQLDLLKEENQALRLKIIELSKAKLQFHQNIQHNHNVPLGALKNNFEIFAELFFKKCSLALNKITSSCNLADIETLKISINAVQDNLDDVISYITHVNDVSKKCQKISICNMDDYKIVNIIDLLQELLHKVVSRYSNKVVLRCEQDIAKALNVYMDKVKLSEAILQLLKNQFQYVPSPSNEIFIEVIRDNMDIMVEMCNGAYIPDEELEQIFEPSTVSKLNISLAGNRGYGITYARYVLEEHSGYVSAKNKNNTTCFYCKLPINNNLVD